MNRFMYQSLVYPKVTPLGRELKSSPYKPGETEQKQSLFMDAFQPIGTRDYIPTDRFDQIHWTASARMQKLQTKEFLPVSSQSVVLMLNTIEKDRGFSDFEKKVERLVSYADYCMKNDIPYSVAINILSFGATPYLLMPSGSGKVQFQKMMVMLAKISDRHAKLPFEEMLRHMESSGQLPQTVVLITHENDRIKALAKQWAKRYEVILDNSHERNERIWDKQSTYEKDRNRFNLSERLIVEMFLLSYLFIFFLGEVGSVMPYVWLLISIIAGVIAFFLFYNRDYSLGYGAGLALVLTAPLLFFNAPLMNVLIFFVYVLWRIQANFNGSRIQGWPFLTVNTLVFVVMYFLARLLFAFNSPEVLMQQQLYLIFDIIIPLFFYTDGVNYCEQSAIGQF